VAVWCTRVQGPGPFYSGTSYRADYPRRELQPIYHRQPEKYHAPSKPMDTKSLYSDTYVAYCALPARSCRPAPVPPVNVPLAKSTEQRDKFKGDAETICPAIPLLQRVPGCVLPADVEDRRPQRCKHRFRYSDRDESGHEWYTFEECHMPGPENIVYDRHRYVRGDSIEAARNREAAARAIRPVPPPALVAVA